MSSMGGVLDRVCRSADINPIDGQLLKNQSLGKPQVRCGALGVPVVHAERSPATAKLEGVLLPRVMGGCIRCPLTLLC